MDIRTFPERVIKRVMLGTQVRVYGRVQESSQQHFEQLALKFYKTSRLDRFFVINPPRTRDGHGRFAIVEPREGGSYDAEGVILRNPHTACAITARDCQFVVIVDRHSGVTGAVHVGRDSLLQNPSCRGCNAGVVRNLLNGVVSLQASSEYIAEHVQVFMGGGICAEHFPHPHDNTGYLAVLECRFGTIAFPDPARQTLDIKAVVKAQLMERGVRENMIECHPDCSFENPKLGSLRGGKPEPNVLIVAR